MQWLLEAWEITAGSISLTLIGTDRKMEMSDRRKHQTILIKYKIRSGTINMVC